MKQNTNFVIQSRFDCKNDLKIRREFKTMTGISLTILQLNNIKNCGFDRYINTNKCGLHKVAILNQT